MGVNGNNITNNKTCFLGLPHISSSKRNINATMLAIVFGDISGKEHMVAASVVIPTLLGAFGIIRIMTNLKFIVDEMDDKMAKTAYGQEIKSIPISVLKFVFAGMYIIVGIFQLTVIY